MNWSWKKKEAKYLLAVFIAIVFVITAAFAILFYWFDVKLDEAEKECNMYVKETLRDTDETNLPLKNRSASILFKECMKSRGF